VPSLDALGHDHPGWQHVGLDDFYNRLQVTNEPVLDVDVHGGTLEPVTQLAPAGETLTVRIITDYTPQDGAAFGPWGLDNPLGVHMTGLGLDERFHLYPGEVLLRAFRLASGALEFACTSCNSTAPFATLQVSGDPNGTGSAPALSQRAHLDPGKFTEVNLQLKKGESFQWSFTTDPPTVLHYDVHSHVGSQVTTHLQGDNETANGTFTAPFDGIFSLFLDNSNPSPVDVLYQVEGGTPYVPKSFLPGPPEALALVALGALALALRRR
jgi:hypothetical protein